MPMWLQWTLILGGLMAIAGLVFVIRRQLRTLSEARRSQQKTQAFQAKRRQDMIDSIRIIAQAVEEDQIEYSEACLRLKGLLDHLEPRLLEQSPYRVFRLVQEKLAHMPTHRARKQADAELIEKLDKERFAVEREHADEIRRAASAIRQYPFEPAVHDR